MLLPNNGYVWDVNGNLVLVEHLELRDHIRVLAQDKVTRKPVYSILPIKNIFRSNHSIKMLKTQQRYENIQNINMFLTDQYYLNQYFITRDLFIFIKFFYLPAIQRGTLKRLNNGDYVLTPDKEAISQFSFLITNLNLSYDENKNFLLIPKSVFENVGDLVHVHIQKYSIMDAKKYIVFPNGLMSDPVFKNVAEKALLEGCKVFPVQEEMCYNTLVENGAGRKGLVMDSPEYLVNVDFNEKVKAIPIVYTARDGKAFGARWVTD